MGFAAMPTDSVPARDDIGTHCLTKFTYIFTLTRYTSDFQVYDAATYPSLNGESGQGCAGVP